MSLERPQLPQEPMSPFDSESRRSSEQERAHQFIKEYLTQMAQLAGAENDVTGKIQVYLDSHGEELPEEARALMNEVSMKARSLLVQMDKLMMKHFALSEREWVKLVAEFVEDDRKKDASTRSA